MTTEAYAYAEQPGETPEAPLLLLFHGTGGDETQFLELGPQLLPGARLVAPRGDVSEGGALRYFRRLAEGRYDMADLERATSKMAAFVSALATNLATVIGTSNVPMTFGSLQTRLDVTQIRTEIALDYGISSRLGLQALIPYVKNRVHVLANPGGDGTIGFNPGGG